MLVRDQISNVHINKSVDSYLRLSNKVIIAKGDNEIFTNYGHNKDKHALHNNLRNTSINIKLLNTKAIASTLIRTILLLNILSSKVKEAAVLPNLHSIF